MYRTRRWQSIRRSRGCLALMAWVLCTLVSAKAVFAEPSPAFRAWEAFAALGQSLGARVETGALRDDGQNLYAEDVRLIFGLAPAALVLDLGTITLSPLSDARFALSVPPQLRLTPSRFEPGNTNAWVIEHDLAPVLELGAQGAVLELLATNLTVNAAPLARAQDAPGKPLAPAPRETTSLAALGISGTLRSTFSEPSAVTGRLALEHLLMVSEIDAGQGLPFRQGVRSEANDITVDLALNGGSALQQQGPGFLSDAFARGFQLRLTVNTGPQKSTIKTELDEHIQIIETTSEPTLLILTLSDGALTVKGEGTASRISSRMGDMRGELELSDSSFALALPLVASTKTQEFGLRLATAFTLAAPDETPPTPPGMAEGFAALAGENGRFTLDLRGEGRLLADVPDWPLDEPPPMILRELALRDLTVALGTMVLSGEGKLSFPETLMTEKVMEQGAGDFRFRLRGGEAFLNRLVATGLITSDQLFFARSMLALAARPLGPDDFESALTLLPGGQMLLNGQPLPF